MDGTTVTSAVSAASGKGSVMSETISTALSTAFSSIKTDVLGGIETALPAALAIGGAVIAIRICWRFFKSAAN